MVQLRRPRGYEHPRLIEEAYRRFHFEDEEEIAGAYVLVLAELKRSADLTKNISP
jgi:hypothetical protein